MAKISVIVPVYNVEKYIAQCIESIINQTYKDLEILLIDDGSVDSSWEICNLYATRDPRIKVMHKKNGGVVSARKAGILKATGKYVGFVDGDDWIEPEMYQYLGDIMEKYNASIVETGILHTGRKSVINSVPKYEEGLYCGKKFTDIVMPTMMYTGKFFSSGISPYLFNKLFVREKIINYIMRIKNRADFMEDGATVYPYLIQEKSLFVSKNSFYHYRKNVESLKRNPAPNIYETLRNNFEIIVRAASNSIYRENFINQCKYSMIYHYIWCMPWIFDKEKILAAFGGIEEGCKIILYGAGAVGINFYRYLSSCSKITIIDWVDRDFEELGKNIPVNNPIFADYESAEKIVITVLRYDVKEEIVNELIRAGIDREKIMWIEERYIQDPQILLDLIEK